VQWEGRWPGDHTFEHQGVRFGFEICEDAWRPDDVQPACKSQGKVDLIDPSASLHGEQDRPALLVLRGFWIQMHTTLRQPARHVGPHDL
jgi:predicted amidohydrolase